MKITSLHTLFITLLSILTIQTETLWAIGGDDSTPANQIGSDSQDCQEALLSATRSYINTRVNAISSCVNDYLDCESSANSTNAEACRAALLEVGVGACAVDVLDSGIETMANTAAVVSANSSAALDQAVITFVNAINADCYAAINTDLGTGGTGLGFSGDVSTNSKITDRLNQIPGGMGCQANRAVRVSTPLIDLIADHLKTFDNKCIAVSDGETLYQSCDIDDDCGASSGKCGKIAFALKNGDSSGFPDCSRACQPGEYLPNGALECVPCPLGKFSNSINATDCTPCSAGSYADLTKSRQCTLCPRGYVQPDAEAINCIPCNPGEYQDTTGEAVCKNCTAGTFSSSAAVSCTSCAAGTFSDTQAHTCTPCGAGTFAASSGSSICSPCPVGTYSEVSGRASCTVCPVGTFAGSQGSDSCTPCAAGSFAATTQSSSCQSCAAGTYSVAGSSECIACPAGTFSSTGGAGSCTPCTAGTFSEQGATTCTPCAAGTFSEQEGASSCTRAPSGSFVSSAGQTQASQCQRGTFNSDSGADECSLCAPGTYAPIEGAKTCVKCPKDTIAPKAGAKSCKPCTKGTSNRKRTKCV